MRNVKVEEMSIGELIQAMAAKLELSLQEFMKLPKIQVLALYEQKRREAGAR